MSVESVKAYLQDIFSNKKFLLIIFISALFLGASLYVYVYYVMPKLNPSFVPNREFVKEKKGDNTVGMYFFYTNWCPHSKKSKPIWEEVKKEYNGKEINGMSLSFVEINGETDENALADFEGTYKVKVEGYPSIYMVKDDQVIEYDAKPTKETLDEFIHATL